MPSYRRRWYLHPYALTIVGVLVVVGLHQTGALGGAEAVFVRAMRPAQWALATAGNALGWYWTERKSLEQLRGENLRLTTAWQQLAVENQQLKQQLREFTALQEQAEFLRQRSLPALPVRVIGKDLSQSAQAIVIDRGRRSGITAGSPVVVRNGILIGRVEEVGEELAKVMLLTDGRSVTPAALDGRGEVTGVARGEFGVSLKLDLIPVDQKLTAGDVVVTSGQEARVPSGLIIGTVSRLADEPTQFFHVAYLQPVVSYQTLSVAAVLLER